MCEHFIIFLLSIIIILGFFMILSLRLKLLIIKLSCHVGFITIIRLTVIHHFP